MPRILWKDASINFGNVIVICLTITGLLIFPLIFLLFNEEHFTRLAIVIYLVDLPLALFILLFLIYEKNRYIHITEAGITIDWKPQTGSRMDDFEWGKIKRINLINSWSKKSYTRWANIRSDFALKIFLLSVINANIVIIEDVKDKIHMIGIVNPKGFNNAINEIKKTDPVINEIPILNYGVL